MSEKEYHSASPEVSTSAEIAELINIVNALDVHRAALIWRNFLVRRTQLHLTYEARVLLAQEIRAAAHTADTGNDWTHLAPVLGEDGADPGSMKADLIYFLRRYYIVPMAEKQNVAMTAENLIQLRQQYAANVSKLDAVVHVLQGNHVVHPDVLEIIQKLEGLHEANDHAGGLDIQKEYLRYSELNRTALVLLQRAEELLQPSHSHEHADT